VYIVKNGQPDSKNRTFTRRQWLGRIPPSAIAVAFGAGLGGERGFAAGQLKNDPGANDFGARVYNIRNYGAKGDGIALDTAALQSAINACHQDGGGMVLVPAGTFQIGTVELKSNVTLHIAAALTRSRFS
jgi:hypothetical protein